MMDLSRGEHCLYVSEFYTDTIQGEGIHIGHPATFLRLKGCVMHCEFCDTAEVWKYGSYYSVKSLLDLIRKEKLDERFVTGQHLVITGGSPLLQQKAIIKLLEGYMEEYGWFPFVEMENECVLPVDPALIPFVGCWNNSPKLASSGVEYKWRYKPSVIRDTAALPSSWFKFVVTCEEDWNEIEELFLKPMLIQRSQIILMPQGATRAELTANSEAVVEIAVRHNVRHTTREHIVLWDKTVGI